MDTAGIHDVPFFERNLHIASLDTSLGHSWIVINYPMGSFFINNLLFRSIQFFKVFLKKTKTTTSWPLQTHKEEAVGPTDSAPAAATLELHSRHGVAPALPLTTSPAWRL